MAYSFNHFYRCPFCKTGHVSPIKLYHDRPYKCLLCFHPLRFEQTDAVPVEKATKGFRTATSDDAGTYISPERFKELEDKYGRGGK